ncbi:MAG: hypothetical protein JRH11_20195, partial [Deltaproteobacteria bacterium]|nr:hypothetical protein [Deltaproteobacteria bacterium]
MPRSLLRRVWAASIVAALIGAVGGTVAGRADAEDSRQARATGESPEDAEDCNDAIPEEVIAALEEMAGPDDALAEAGGDGLDDRSSSRPGRRPGRGAESANDGWIIDSRTAVIESPMPDSWLPRGRRC